MNYPRYFIINPENIDPNLNRNIDYWILLNDSGLTKSIMIGKSNEYNNTTSQFPLETHWEIWIKSGFVIEIPAAELALII